MNYYLKIHHEYLELHNICCFLSVSLIKIQISSGTQPLERNKKDIAGYIPTRSNSTKLQKHVTSPLQPVRNFCTTSYLRTTSNTPDLQNAARPSDQETPTTSAEPLPLHNGPRDSKSTDGHTALMLEPDLQMTALLGCGSIKR